MTESTTTTTNLIAQAQADFALNLLREVSFGDTNNNSSAVSAILSPISVAIALSMVYAGAKEETANSLGQMLAKGLPESDANEVHEYFGSLLQAIKNGEKNYTLEMANKVYVKNGFSILDTYKAIIDRHYQGQFESVDFGQAQATAKQINSFVEQATHDKIHDLIKPEMFNDLTRMVLINAIYFKGNWANQFKSDMTKKETFYVSEGLNKQLNMMHKTHKFIYHETAELQILGMPYVGEEVFMFVLLPKERFGLHQMLSNLNGQTLLEYVQFRHKQEVIVSLPKFKLESTHELNEPLKKLGIANAFGNSANFSGISAEEPLKIDKVVQKAFIELNEEGTEAAGATGIVLQFRNSLRPSKPEFIANHPFTFVLAQLQQQSATEEVGTQHQSPIFLFDGIFAG